MGQIETTKDCIKIMMAANEKYVIPLTVTALSLMDTVDKSRKVHIYVIDFDIRSESKTKITESLNEYLLDNSLTLEFLPIRDKDKNKVHPTVGCIREMFLGQALGTGTSEN